MVVHVNGEIVDAAWANDLETRLGVSNPPADKSGLGSGVFYSGGVLKVAYEVLNAHTSGDLDPTSTADQHAGLQSFINKIAAVKGSGYIPQSTNANGYYSMGNTQITSPATTTYSLHGDGGGAWQQPQDSWSRFDGTTLKWTADNTGISPETQGAFQLGPSCRLSRMTIVGPTTYTGHYGQRPSYLSGVQLLGGGCHIDELMFYGWGTGVLVGGSGISGDHWNASRIGMTAVGFGFYTATGTSTSGDVNLKDIQIDAYLACHAIAPQCPTYQGGSYVGAHLYGPYGFMRFDDGTSSAQAVLLAAMDFSGCNIEAPGNACIYDELWASATAPGVVLDNRFGLGMFGAPGPAWGRTWTQTCTITASGSNTITVTDSFGGFVFRKGMLVTGNANIPANTTVTAISGTWPAASYTLTLSNTVTSPTGTCVIAQPVLATIVAGSVYDNHFGGSILAANQAGAPFIGFGFGGTCRDNTSNDGAGAFALATSSTVTNSGVQAGVAACLGGSGGPTAKGNRWGQSEGGGTKLTSMRAGAAVAQWDLVQSGVSGGILTVKPTVAASPVTGQVIGIAMQGVASFFMVDVCCSATSVTVRNKSGTNTIASGALIYPDAANAGGVSSTVNGAPIGVALALIAISSTGSAQLFAS